MACYPLAFLITGPIVGISMEKLGRKNFVVFGSLFMTIATGTFGLAAYVGKTAGLFFTVSIIARTLQGIADGMATCTMYSIIVMEYPKQQELYLGYLNMAIGVGTCIGPILGSLLARVLTYGEVFSVLAALISFSFFAAAFLLPSRLNNSRPPRTESMEK